MPRSLVDSLEMLSHTRVTVFGDFCLDAYWHLDESEQELSVETRLPVRRVRTQRYSLGGAGNVAANLIDLGVREVRAVGAYGADLFGGEMLGLLKQRGVHVSGLLNFGETWQTMVYAKPIRSDGEDSRIDFGAFNEFSGNAIDQLLDQATAAAGNSDAVIFNQQVPGGINTPAVIERLNAIIADHPGTKFIVDARHHPGLYRGAVLKLNLREAAAMSGEIYDQLISEQRVVAMARSLFNQTQQPVFITRGENGILVADGSGVQAVSGIQIIGEIDPVGAGDTVVAALAATLAGGCDVLTAATIANLAASVTVRKLHTTGTATRDEILASSASRPSNH